MYCKVCFDAGKPEEVFTSHTVKNQFGMVTCVTLLEHNCESCGCIGHTPKYCPAVKPVKETPKFCPVCRDAGREYNHDLTVDDVVVCEYLLSLECGNCGELGHTRKYCIKPPPKFCPVCKDAGKDHEHDLMKEGIVVCEYLLGLECGNCGELGHTPKYCTRPRRKTALQKMQETNNLASRLENALSHEAPKSKNKGKRKFVRVL